MFSHANYLNKAVVQKFLTQHIQFNPVLGIGVCFNYNHPFGFRYWHLAHCVVVVARGSMSLFSPLFCITQTSL